MESRGERGGKQEEVCKDSRRILRPRAESDGHRRRGMRTLRREGAFLPPALGYAISVRWRMLCARSYERRNGRPDEKEQALEERFDII